MQTEKGNNSESFELHDPEAVYEAAFQAQWDQLTDGAVLTDTAGLKVHILSRGEWNHEAGPDFRNAKIRYQGKILHGDIELHRKSSDYIRHGHLADAAYGNVILHVVEEDDLQGREEACKDAEHFPLHQRPLEGYKRYPDPNQQTLQDGLLYPVQISGLG